MKSTKNDEENMENSVETQLINTAEEVFTEENEIYLSSERTDIIGWDSLGNLKLMMALEEEFEIVFDEDDFEDVTSIQSLYESILSKVD